MIVVTLLCRYAWVVTLQSDIWTRVAMLVNVWYSHGHSVAIRWVGGCGLELGRLFKGSGRGVGGIFRGWVVCGLGKGVKVA